MKNKKRWSIRGRRREGGNIILEMAMVLPIFLLIIGGIVDFAFIYWQLQIMTDATREGARAASLAGLAVGGNPLQTPPLYDASCTTCNGQTVRSLVKNYLDQNNVTDAHTGALVDLGSSGFSSNKYSYTWTGSSPGPFTATVRVMNIGVQMLLLPIVGLGGPTGIIDLGGKTTIDAEWNVPPTNG